MEVLVVTVWRDVELAGLDFIQPGRPLGLDVYRRYALREGKLEVERPALGVLGHHGHQRIRHGCEVSGDSRVTRGQGEAESTCRSDGRQPEGKNESRERWPILALAGGSR